MMTIRLWSYYLLEDELQHTARPSNCLLSDRDAIIPGIWTTTTQFQPHHLFCSSCRLGRCAIQFILLCCNTTMSNRGGGGQELALRSAFLKSSIWNHFPRLHPKVRFLLVSFFYSTGSLTRVRFFGCGPEAFFSLTREEVRADSMKV